MAGMIQMAQPGQQPQQQPPGPEQQPEGGGNEEAYNTAVTLARSALYGSGGGEAVAKALQGARDVSKALADTAYEMISIVDERTDGQVPDEMLVSLATEILSEVVEIGQAAGVDIKGADIARAMQSMLLRYVSEQGLDPRELQQAMGQIDPNKVGAMLDQQMAETPAENEGEPQPEAPEEVASDMKGSK